MKPSVETQHGQGQGCKLWDPDHLVLITAPPCAVLPLWPLTWLVSVSASKKHLKKLKIELPYDPAIPLLGIYLEKNMDQKGTCTPMFIAALFTIAKTRKQPKCPSTEEWIKKM